jgi:hypothetical protein
MMNDDGLSPTTTSSLLLLESSFDDKNIFKMNQKLFPETGKYSSTAKTRISLCHNLGWCGKMETGRWTDRMRSWVGALGGFGMFEGTTDRPYLEFCDDCPMP